MSLTSLVKPLGIAAAVFAASGRQWSCSPGALSAASVGSSCQRRDPAAATRSSHQGSDPAVAGCGVLALAPRLYLVPALRLLLLCCSTCPLECVLQVAAAAALRERHNRSRTDAGPLLPMALHAMSGSLCLPGRPQAIPGYVFAIHYMRGHVSTCAGDSAGKAVPRHVRQLLWLCLAAPCCLPKSSCDSLVALVCTVSGRSWPCSCRPWAQLTPAQESKTGYCRSFTVAL